MPGPGAAVKALTNTPEGTRFRAQLFNIPGADFQPEFTEFTSLDRHASKPRMQDPGPAMLTLEVRDIKPKLDVALKNGGTMVSLGGVVRHDAKDETASTWSKIRMAFTLNFSGVTLCLPREPRRAATSRRPDSARPWTMAKGARSSTKRSSASR